MKLLRELQPPSDLVEKLKNEFLYGNREEELADLRAAVKAVRFEAVRAAIARFILESIEADTSAKYILGLKSNNLEGILSLGWKVERILDDFELTNDNFTITDPTLDKIRLRYG